MVRWWLAVVLVCGGVMSRDIALAGSGWDYGGGEGRFGSPAAACKEMVGTDGYYIYSHVEKAPSGDYYCYSKPKDGEGKPDYIGLVSEVVKPESIEGEKQSESSSPAAVKPEKQQKAEIVKTRADVRTHLHHVFPQKFYSQFKAVGIDVGSTPFSRTVELRACPPVAARPVFAAAGDCASARCNQRYPLSPRPWSGTGVDSPARV